MYKRQDAQGQLLLEDLLDGGDIVLLQECVGHAVDVADSSQAADDRCIAAGSRLAQSAFLHCPLCRSTVDEGQIGVARSKQIRSAHTARRVRVDVDSLETATNLAFIGSIKDDILDIEELACGLLSGVRVIYPQRLMERYKLDEQALALPPYDLLQAIGAKRGMLISGGEVDTERAAKMLVGEFRASKWGRISLERPPQRDDLADFAEDDDE